MKKIKWVVPTFYIIFLMLPIYWLLNMSFKSTTEIINVYSLWPQDFTLDNYKTIFTDSTWYMGYVNSIMYTVFNTIISVSAALPAAYAFSRYKFLGDKHLFFWLLTNRMAPPAVFALPFFQFYSSVNLFDTHIAIALSHCLFNIPLAVWILEGFMSAVPKELDESAKVDGCTQFQAFRHVIIPVMWPGVITTGLFSFLLAYNDFAVTAMLLSEENRTMVPQVAAFLGTTYTEGNIMFAVASVVSATAPLFILVMFFQRQIVSGLTQGAVKG